MSSSPLIITFADASTAEGNRLAGTLAEALRDVDPGIVVEGRRERADTQDFGASLAVMLGTAAATAVAKGIASWMARNSGATIKIHRNGKVAFTGTNLASKDVARIVEALSSKE
jgi:electron transfer flavoprotein alpha/beta subunit